MALAGELDLAAAPHAEAELREAGAHADLVVVNLAGLTFMDRAGLRALLAARSRLRRIGGQVVIVHIPPQVRRLLELSGPEKRLLLGWDPATENAGCIH